ncbi:cupin domain-containing protein [Gammaproteobacteria bacterium]|nr:cupin domain-containing protein [Gammaproteobacteria bacterium]
MLHGNGSANDPSTVEVEVMAKSSTSWDGENLPNYARGMPEVTILKIVIPPGTTLPVHKHSMINAGVLLKGELTVVTQENKTLHLKSGDTIVEVVNKWHYGKNEGKKPAEIIVFYAGTVGEPLSIKK